MHHRQVRISVGPLLSPRTRRSRAPGFMLALSMLVLSACDTSDTSPAGVELNATGTGGQRPNIVVILTDDAGFSDIGAYGGEIDTPHIDALARGGLRFRQFYSNARCSPTRATLLTGLYPARVGFAAGTLAGWTKELPREPYRGRLSLSAPTIAEILADNGYDTFMAGKWHLGGSTTLGNPDRESAWRRTHPGWTNARAEFQAERAALPTRRGFDQYFGSLLGEVPQFLKPDTRFRYFSNEKTAPLEKSGTYDIYGLPFSSTASPSVLANGLEATDAFYSIDGVTDRALRMIRPAAGTERDRPFFLYLAYQAPHAPLQADKARVEKYLRRYAGDDEVALRLQRIDRLVAEGLLAESAAESARRQARLREPLITDERRRTIATHAAMLETVDHNIGKLIEALRDRNELDNTLIFVLSDNGASVRLAKLANTPFTGGKGLLWEGGLRTHAIVHWPAVVSSDAITATVGWVGDILPTVLDATGTDYPARWRGRSIGPLDGRSLLPTLRGGQQTAPDTLFFNDRGQQALLWKGRWKLLMEPGWYANTSRSETRQTLFYDLAADPHETTPLPWWRTLVLRSMIDRANSWREEQGIVDYGAILAAREATAAALAETRDSAGLSRQ